MICRVRHLAHNGSKCQMYIVLISDCSPFLMLHQFLKENARIKAINCISYYLKALSMSTFKDVLIGESLMSYILTSSQKFSTREVITHWLCEFLCSPIYNGHGFNLKITGNCMAHNKT